MLRTPAFHRAVEKVAKGVHRVRHGTPPEELGGTKIDKPGDSGFLGHFVEEVKTQLGQAEGKSGNAGVNMDSRALSHQGAKSKVEEKAAKVDEETADAAWRDAQSNASQPQKQGFLNEYIDALRQQVKNGKRM